MKQKGVRKGQVEVYVEERRREKETCGKANAYPMEESMG